MIRPIVLANECFRVYLVGEVEKWENRKYCNFLLFCLLGSEKVEEQKKLVCINFIIYSCLKKKKKHPK